MENDAFHTTRWTLVCQARGTAPEARQALSELCAAYYEPVVAFLRRGGREEDAARDLTHEFFAQVLENHGLSAAEQERGRFRSYLLGAVKHFFANHQRERSRKKRGGGSEHLTLAYSDDTSPGVELVDAAALPPDAAFDREWALALVDRALSLLQAECESAGHGAQFAALKPWLTPTAPLSAQASVAAQLSLTEGAIKVAIHRLRRRFRQIVRSEVAQTLHSASNLEDEMRHLVAALAR